MAACKQYSETCEDRRVCDAVENGFRPADVVMGRGKGIYERQGNKAYMEIISSFVPAYRTARKNADKIRITQDVIALVKQGGGRFLGMNPRNKQVYEVSDGEARIKVSQALRHRRLVTERNRKRAGRRQDQEECATKEEEEEDERWNDRPSNRERRPVPKKRKTAESVTSSVVEPLQTGDSEHGAALQGVELRQDTTMTEPGVDHDWEPDVGLSHPWLCEEDMYSSCHDLWKPREEDHSLLSWTGLTEEDLESLMIS